MASVTCVLMGVAEVKVPLQRLPREVRIKVANISHWAVVHRDHDSEDSEQAKDCQKFIGEVDNFYGLREVEVKLEDGSCQITHGSEIVFQHRSRDVIVAMPMKGLRVVYVSRCSSYSRGAVVLQMKSQEEMDQLLGLFPHAAIDALYTRPSSCSHEPTIKDYKASWSRGVGKKFTSMLTSITGPAIQQVKKSPMMARKVFSAPEPTDSPAPDSEHSSDSDSDEDSVTDEVDSKSAGEYYKNIGLDASVQERLYDNATDTDSRSSNHSLESNMSMIEAELKFFFETDNEFFKSIQSLTEDRERLSNDETPQFIRENLTLLFAQVKSLIQLHTKLHSEFEECCNDLQLLSTVITRHAAEYENYVYFMENIPTVDRILQTHKDYFKTHVPDLPEKLRKPRMRLHYYVLTMETLHKRSSNPEDKKALQDAMDILKKVLKKADSKLFLGAVEDSPFDLTNFGTLIRHSDLALRRGPGDLPRRVYHVLMLKDLLLLTTRNGMDYRYVTSFRMDQVGLGKYERGILLNLEVRNGPRGQVVLYTFKAKNINMQQLWIKDLKAHVEEEKATTTTPRTSYIESDSDIRYSSSRSQGRQRQLINRVSERSISQSSQNDSDMTDEVRSGRTENNTTWTGSGRRAAIKKTSSASSKGKPVVRQQSGYSSDGEGSTSKWKILDQLPQLTVWSRFPYLKELCEQRSQPSGTKGTPFTLILALLAEEKKYINNLTYTLGKKLEEGVPQPPESLVPQIRHLYEFHSEVFLPLLQKSASSRDKREVAQCFLDCSYGLKLHYSRYLVDISQLYDELFELNLLDSYKLPVEHLKQYLFTLSALQCEDHEVIPSLQTALSMLCECVSDANSILLTELIERAPFDLMKQGPALLEGPAKVRRNGLPIRQDFHVVLLDTMILLLEPHPPYFYRYVDALRMDTVGLGPVLDDYTFQLEVRTAATKMQTYIFKTPSHSAKAKWLSEITRILKLQVDRLKEKQKRRLGYDEREYKILEGGNEDQYTVSPRRKIESPEQSQGGLGKKTLETHM